MIIPNIYIEKQNMFQTTNQQKNANQSNQSNECRILMGPCLEIPVTNHLHITCRLWCKGEVNPRRRELLT